MIFDILRGGYSTAETLVILAVFAFAVVVAISCHEFAHAYAALKAGDSSAKRAGRLTLNPAAHFEPLGLLCFLFAGIGWAKPVPVNPFNYRNFKRGNFWVSIAGIVTNLVIAFICSFGYFIAETNGWGSSSNLILLGLYWLFMLLMVLNVSLAVFNLLPIPPLDGYNLLVSFTKPNNSFMRFVRENGMIILLLFVAFGGFIIFTVRSAVMNAFLSFWGLLL